MRGLISAFRTLTGLPMPGREADHMAAALPFFPVVGAVIGLAVSAVVFLFAFLGWPLGSGVLGVLTVVLVTRGLHVDGLADVADAAGGYTRERRLEIMKDPHVGAFGVAAIVLDLTLKSAALARLATGAAWPAIILAFAASRTVLVMLAVLLPYARREGGTAEAFVQGASVRHLALALVAGAVLCYALAGLQGLVALFAAHVIGAMLLAWMQRVYGGITGDLLGTANEVIENALLVLPCLPFWNAMWAR
jgi:adenosylcobinamide-GDP ribazoletransferase